MASGLLSLKWNNHRSTFFHVLSSIRSKESYCDATLACDGRFYPVHKLVLSTCSEYFEQIFERTQCKHPVIVLKDIKFEDLEALMNYMYVGEVNVLQEKLSGLIKAAECLRIKGLAVPDEDPFASKENRRNQHRTEFESPRAKRRRRDDSFSNEERVKNVSSRERPLVRDPQPLENHENNILASPKATDLSSQGLMSSFSKSDKLVVAVESEIQDEEDTETNSKPNSGEVIPPKITSHKRNVELQISMVETNVKAEPPDIEIPGDDDLDSKENLNSDLGYDQDSVGGDESGSAHGGNDSEYSENLMESAPQSVEDVVAQALPSSSNFQGNSFSLWEGENSLQNFPGEGFSGENSQGRQVVDSKDMTAYEEEFGSVQEILKIVSVNSLKECAGKSFSIRGFIPYRCSSCYKVLSCASALQTHERVHTREKPFQCNICPFRANQKGNLIAHMRIHTEDNPFACVYCCAKFRSSSNLSRHISTLHNNS